jgi:hypothetical protein
MEAGLGAIWGKDSQYFRDAGAPFKNRLAQVFVMTFVARNRDGNPMPATSLTCSLTKRLTALRRLTIAGHYLTICPFLRRYGNHLQRVGSTKT